jgi:hypothetical protein
MAQVVTLKDVARRHLFPPEQWHLIVGNNAGNSSI